MKRFVQVSLIAATLALSMVPTVSTALPRFYRETIFYDMRYYAGPGHTPSPGVRVEVGWHRYYCDGTVRTFGSMTGDFEDYEFGTCD